MKFDAERFAQFFALLPHNTQQAARLASQHDQRLEDRNWLESDVAQAVRHAVEIRHKSFRDPEFIRLLRKYKIALVCADTVGLASAGRPHPRDFVYCRLHGSEELYVSGYDGAALDQWGGAGAGMGWWRGIRRIWSMCCRRRKPTAGRDVFVYFDNDVKVRAPVDAQFADRAGEIFGTAMTFFREESRLLYLVE